MKIYLKQKSRRIKILSVNAQDFQESSTASDIGKKSDPTVDY